MFSSFVTKLKAWNLSQSLDRRVILRVHLSLPVSVPAQWEFRLSADFAHSAVRIRSVSQWWCWSGFNVVLASAAAPPVQPSPAQTGGLLWCGEKILFSPFVSSTFLTFLLLLLLFFPCFIPSLSVSFPWLSNIRTSGCYCHCIDFKSFICSGVQNSLSCCLSFSPQLTVEYKSLDQGHKDCESLSSSLLRRKKEAETTFLFWKTHSGKTTVSTTLFYVPASCNFFPSLYTLVTMLSFEVLTHDNKCVSTFYFTP